MNRAWATVTAWVIGPPAVAALVVVLGDLGALGWPPPPSGLPDWLAAADPAVAVASTLRLAVVAACVLTSLRVGVALIDVVLTGPRTRSPRGSVAPRSLSEALCRAARPALVAGLGVGLVSSTAMAASAGAAHRRALATPAPTHAVEAPAGEDGVRRVQSAPSPPKPGRSFAEMRRVRIEFASFTEACARPDAPEVWVVERGDHLWSIATETLREHLGETPSRRRVIRYWQRLIEANRDRLVIPGEPDVIMPGQRLVLPRPASGADQRSGT